MFGRVDLSMSYKIPKFIMASIVSTMLFACGIESEEISEAIDDQDEIITPIESEEEPETKEVEKVEEVEEVAKIANNETEEVGEETKEATTTESVAEEQVETPIVIEVDEIEEKALDKLIVETHLEKEGYSYLFLAVDPSSFVEIEVMEKTNKEVNHMPLEGVYRYLIDTEEILIRDYLTGDFIPYEKTE